MKKLLFPVLFMLIATSCATIKVSSDFDKTASFSAYKTFTFTPDALNLAVDDLNKTRIITAVENELKLKGFTKADNPDVLIDLKLVAKTIQTATANTSGGYGYGYRYRWGGGFTTTTIDYDSYNEGTLFVDMIDAKKLQLVWQGRGVGTIAENISAEKREENIKYAVKMIFEKYPPAVK
jgi:hypothetical protein